MFRSLRFPHLLIGVASLGAMGFTAPAARAQTTATETARVTQLFKNGKAAFAKGDMPEAERLFAEAFAIRKSSDIAANLGQSELEQQKFRKAAEHFQWALANLLPSATDAQRKAVETGLGRSRAEVAVLRLDIKPEGSDVLVGEQNVGKSPVAGGVYVDAGEVIVSVKHDGFVAIDKRVMVGKGTEQTVEVTLAPRDSAVAPGAPRATPVDSGLEHPAPAAATADVPVSKQKSLVPAFVATGVAVAGGVVGLVFTLSANSKSDKADEKVAALGGPGACSTDGRATAADPAERARQCDDLQGERDSVDTSRNIAVGSFIVGGVAAVAAGYFYWDALSHRESAAAARPRPLLGLKPSVDFGHSRSSGVASPDSVKFSISGTF